MKNCLDCLHCKIIRTKGIIYCKQDMWPHDTKPQKIIKLKSSERHTEFIEHRDIFLFAPRCPVMISMD